MKRVQSGSLLGNWGFLWEVWNLHFIPSIGSYDVCVEYLPLSLWTLAYSHTENTIPWISHYSCYSFRKEIPFIYSLHSFMPCPFPAFLVPCEEK